MITHSIDWPVPDRKTWCWDPIPIRFNMKAFDLITLPLNSKTWWWFLIPIRLLMEASTWCLEQPCLRPERYCKFFLPHYPGTDVQSWTCIINHPTVSMNWCPYCKYIFCTVGHNWTRFISCVRLQVTRTNSKTRCLWIYKCVRVSSKRFLKGKRRKPKTTKQKLPHRTYTDVSISSVFRVLT